MTRNRPEVAADEQLVGIPYVAERLGLSARTVGRRMAAGDLGPVVDVSQDGERAILRVRLVAVEAYLERRTADPAAVSA